MQLNTTDIYFHFYQFFILVGLELAKNNNCYYGEVSVPLQLNVDKVLVDITDQLQSGYKTNSMKTLQKPPIKYDQSGKQEEENLRKKSRFSLFSRLRKFFLKKILKLFPES